MTTGIFNSHEIKSVFYSEILNFKWVFPVTEQVEKITIRVEATVQLLGILRAIVEFNIFIVLVSRTDTFIDNFIYFRSWIT